MFALLAALSLGADGNPTPFAGGTPPNKEPTYKAAPQYMLLAFGLKAETRIWLVLDGERLYVDRNGDGDLTQAGEFVAGAKKDGRLTFSVGELREKGRTHTDVEVALFEPHEGSGLGKFPRWRELKKRDPGARMVSVQAQIDRRGLPGDSEPTEKDAKRTWSQDASTDYFGCLQFAPTVKEASVVHFNGPLTLGLQMPYLDDGTLVAGQSSELESGLGCRGRGPGSFAFVNYQPVPKAAHPSVEIQWPGDAPKERMTLGERC